LRRLSSRSVEKRNAHLHSELEDVMTWKAFPSERFLIKYLFLWRDQVWEI